MNEIQLPHISDEDHQHLSYITNTDDLVDWITDYATQAVIVDRAQRDAEHLAELRAYELTAANLREQLAQQAPQVPMTDAAAENLAIIGGIWDCLLDPWDKLNNGDEQSSVLPDMVRLIRAVEAFHNIKEKP